MEGMIKFTDMLRVMTTGDPFSFEVVSLNLKEETGGFRTTYTNAVLLAAGNSSKNSRKNPKNFLNVTRTIKVPTKSRPITVHALLITRFNDEKTYI